MSDNLTNRSPKQAAPASKASPAVSQGASVDYIGENGLLICGVCHHPKQHRLQLSQLLGGETRLVGCLCQCEMERLEAEQQELRLAADRERVKRLRRQSLMDKAFWESRFELAIVDAGNQGAFHLARSYVERFSEMLQINRGILLYGSPGTGKTYLAACIANALLEQGVPVLMTSFVKLNQLPSQPMDDGGLLDAMNRARLLILDDLGAERSTDYSIERVYHVIDNRVRLGLPMILTTNLSLEEMKYQEDIRYQRIYDRLFQHCYLAEVTGVSRRLREAAKLYREMEQMSHNRRK